MMPGGKNLEKILLNLRIGIIHDNRTG